MSSSLETEPAQKRRDFLVIATTAFGATGAATSIWPFIDSMNPSSDVTAMSRVEVDVSDLKKGQRITALWRGKPVFIARRTKAEIDQAQLDDLADLPDPAIDANRVHDPEWLIVIGVCTHFGCVPLGQKSSTNIGDFGGWFCPCHGSHYDTSGRIRKGPAPRNLDLPIYRFKTPKIIVIG